MDYQGLPDDILDEIALEGLDGITISALWTRLRTRKGFSVALDGASMKYLWGLVSKNKSVQMFVLQEPRPALEIHNHHSSYEPELDMLCEPEQLPDDIYPVDRKKLIDDKMNRIRGSCLTYHTRINCTDQVKKLSLPEVTEMYGDRLVLVASQVARRTALAGIDAEALESLSVISYVILERIGRSRECGEVTAGKHGLQHLLNMIGKTLLPFRQELLVKKVVVQQAMSMVVSGKSHNGYLLHIPRFYCLSTQDNVATTSKGVKRKKDTNEPASSSSTSKRIRSAPSKKMRIVQRRKPGLAHLKESDQLEQVFMQDFNLPFTLEEFHTKYRLIKLPQTGLRLQRSILEVTNRDEIISATVFNLVHSALCVATMDKTKLGPILFDGVSNSYPDVKIRETLNMMRKDTMVVCAVQRYQTRGSKNYELSLGKGDYKHSLSHTHLLRSGYPFSIFTQCFKYFQRFLDEKNKSETLDNWRGMEVSHIAEGGCPAMVLTMFALGIASLRLNIPKDVIVFDHSILKKNENHHSAHQKSHAEWVKDLNRESQRAANWSKYDLRDLSGRFQKKQLPPTGEIIIEEGNRNNAPKFEAIYMYHNVEFLRIGLRKFEGQSSISSISWCPQPLKPSRLKTRSVEEPFVLRPCQVLLDIQSPESTSAPSASSSPVSTVFVSPEIPSLAHCWSLYDRNGLKKKAKAAASKILELIQSKQQMGILASDLPVEVGILIESSCSLERHMSLLTESKFVLRVGVVAARYVSFYHINPWLVPSCRITATVDPLQESSDGTSSKSDALKETKQAISQPVAKRAKIDGIVETEERTDVMLSLKPWVKVNGEINRPVLDRLLGAVLSHIMTRPGCTILQLTQQFQPAYQPFQIRELVEILAKIECVKLYCLKKSGKPGLFAPRTTVEMAPFSPFSPDKDVYCHPKVDAILCLGIFIGEKKYEDDFIPDSPCHDGQ